MWAAPRCWWRCCCSWPAFGPPDGGQTDERGALEFAYVTLLVVLGSSVLLGTFLAGALPGQ